MKAMIIDGFGGPEAFHIGNVPGPVPGAGQIVVRPIATSVNPIDTKIRSGAVAGIAPTFPAVLHGDVVGEVVECGVGVSGFSPGDRVVGFAGGVKGHPGVLAEYALLDTRAAALMPDSLPDTLADLSVAAAMPVAGVTAWEALFRRVRIAPGMKVLVHAGTGGVGHVALQLAAIAGAEVATTVSSSTKARLAAELGARHTINYREESVGDYVGRLTGGRGFDIVVDTVGGTVLTDSFAAAAAGGDVVTIAARSTQDLAAVHGKALNLHAVFILLPFLGAAPFAVYQESLPALVKLVSDGRLRFLADDRRFAFTTVGDAHVYLESGDKIGKIIVENDLG